MAKSYTFEIVVIVAIVVATVLGATIYWKKKKDEDENLLRGEAPVIGTWTKIESLVVFLVIIALIGAVFALPAYIMSRRRE